MKDEQELSLIAYQVSELPFRLVPAPAGRTWIDKTRDRFARRCLPVLIANQFGWWITTTVPFTAVWNGGPDKSSITITGNIGGAVISHFGHGIMTAAIPWIFKTPEGYALWVKGPANFPKDGASPLEGVCETFWMPQSFTMNWQLTRPGLPVSWEAGEPICSILPVKTAELERFQTAILPIAADPELRAQYQAWSSSRAQFLHNLDHGEAEAMKRLWEKDYFHGTSPGGASAPEGAHRTKLKLCPFEPK